MVCGADSTIAKIDISIKCICLLVICCSLRELQTNLSSRLPPNSDHYWGPALKFFITQSYLWTTSTCQQRPLFLSPEGDHYNYSGLTVLYCHRIDNAILLLYFCCFSTRLHSRKVNEAWHNGSSKLLFRSHLTSSWVNAINRLLSKKDKIAPKYIRSVLKKYEKLLFVIQIRKIDRKKTHIKFRISRTKYPL